MGALRPIFRSIGDAAPARGPRGGGLSCTGFYKANVPSTYPVNNTQELLAECTGVYVEMGNTYFVG